MLYTGAMEKGQMHGKGALVYPNGEKYEGDFQHGKRHGYGVYSYADGGRFEGEWVDDKVHGRGVSIYSSGNRSAEAPLLRIYRGAHCASSEPHRGVPVPGSVPRVGRESYHARSGGVL